MRIGSTEVFVDDQDKARTFYTDVLGLVVKIWDNNKEPIGSILRLFDLTDRHLVLHWMSPPTGRLEPPMYGTFHAGIGVVNGDDEHDGCPIGVRFVWEEITPTTARWQQAFSTDDGHSWETNWIMRFERRPNSDDSTRSSTPSLSKRRKLTST